MVSITVQDYLIMMYPHYTKICRWAVNNNYGDIFFIFHNINFEVEYPNCLKKKNSERSGLKEKLIKKMEYAFSILLRNVRIKV